MTDDQALREALDWLVPAREEPNEWADVLARISHARGVRVAVLRGRDRSRALVLVFAAVVAVVAVASALAASGVNPFTAFSSWLSGTPGRPASRSAEHQFLEANGHSWAAFPTGTKLRKLIGVTVDHRTYELYGFRSGDSLCLRLIGFGSGVVSFAQPACAPVQLVEETDRPIVIIDNTGSVSFGIVADSVKQVEINAVDGDHRALLGGDAYLWFETEPNTDNHVLSITATSQHGSTTISLPPPRSFDLFSLSGGPSTTGGRQSFEYWDGDGISASKLPGPTRIQAPIVRPTIAWLTHRTPVGLSPSQASLSPLLRRIVAGTFTRFIRPDPLSNLTVGLSEGTLIFANRWTNAPSNFPREGGALGVRTQTAGNSLNSSNEFSDLAGVAADGVTRVRLFFSDGSTETAALKDNIYTAVVPEGVPYKIVAYDERGLVAGIASALSGPLHKHVAPSAAVSSLKPVFHLAAPDGAKATLEVGRAAYAFGRRPVTLRGAPPAEFVRCWRVLFSGGQVQSGCPGIPQYGGPAVYVAGVQPVGRDVFITVQARAPVTRIRIRFKGGETLASRLRDGVALFAVPRSYLKTLRQGGVVTGYRSDGRNVQHTPVYFRANG